MANELELPVGLVLLDFGDGIGTRMHKPGCLFWINGDNDKI